MSIHRAKGKKPFLILSNRHQHQRRLLKALSGLKDPDLFLVTQTLLDHENRAKGGAAIMTTWRLMATSFLSLLLLDISKTV